MGPELVIDSHVEQDKLDDDTQNAYCQDRTRQDRTVRKKLLVRDTQEA